MECLVRCVGPLMVEIKLSLLVLRSPDMERAGAFYNLLGIHFDRERHGTGPEHMAARIGPTVLELYPGGIEPSSAGVRLGFLVASVDSVLEAVRQAGGTVV